MRDFRGIHVAAAEAVAGDYEEPPVSGRGDRFERWRAERTVSGGESAEIATFLADRRRAARASRTHWTKRMTTCAIAAVLSIAMLWFEPTRGVGFVGFVIAGFYGLLALERYLGAALELG